MKKKNDTIYAIWDDDNEEFVTRKTYNDLRDAFLKKTRGYGACYSSIGQLMHYQKANTQYRCSELNGYNFNFGSGIHVRFFVVECSASVVQWGE